MMTGSTPLSPARSRANEARTYSPKVSAMSSGADDRAGSRRRPRGGLILIGASTRRDRFERFLDCGIRPALPRPRAAVWTWRSERPVVM